MNVLIVAETPSIARHIAPKARQHWPDADIYFVNAVPYGNFKFKYPRGAKWSEFPLVSEPHHRLASWSEWACDPLAMSATGELTSVAMSEGLFRAADIIVFACDPDHSGVISFSVLLSKVFGDDRALACPALVLYALDPASIEKAFADMPLFGEIFSEQLQYGQVKRYFDWNWNVNSQAILGETLRLVGVPADAPPLSKYALQLLYGLRNRPAMSEGRVVGLMNNWPGTGRYQGKPGAWHPRLGSCASASQILVNLETAGLLEAVTGGVQLSARGHKLLAALHPDCEDLDLPFRLNAWGEGGLANTAAIDRYVKTFFGKQKRFLAKTAAAA